MTTIEDVRTYLRNEQQIARYVDTPEWQVFTLLLTIADACVTVEQFVTQAQQLPITGPEEEVKEAQKWLEIALGAIQGS